MAKYTPAPWKCDTSGFANAPFIVFTGNVSPKWGHRYPLVGVNWIAEVRDDESEQHPEYVANARLIAAAPEMLEALETLFDITPFATNEKDAEIRMRIRAVIAKAKGEGNRG